MTLLIHQRRRRIGQSIHIDPEPPEPGIGLLGVGSESTSLITYPKIQNTTVGNWYVDSSRPSSGDGTSLATAFKTIQEGLSALQSGQTLLVKGGIYNMSQRIIRNTAYAQRTRIMGYGTDRPILDFSSTDLNSNRDAIQIGSTSRNELWHRFYIRNCRNSGGWGSGFMVQAPTTILSDIWASHTDYRSFSVSGVTTGSVTIQDCVGWRMGDGFTASTSTGEHFLVVGSGRDTHPEEIVLARCVSINGGDDGYDLWSARSVLIIDSVSIGAGYYWNGAIAGDGNGYKMGGDNANGRNNRLRGSVAVRSSRYGIDANISASSQYGQYHYINNTTAYNDSQGFFLGNHVHVENNIDYGNGASYRSPGASTTYANNQWDLGINNPQLADAEEGDYSLLAGSAAIGSGTGGKNLGASTIALELTKLWSERDTTGYALQEWFDEDVTPPAPEPETGLLGVGSVSTSLTMYPKIQNTTVGDWYVDGSRSTSGNGTSLATAFRTIQEGLAALQSGQTLLVKGGTYNLTARLNRTTNWGSQTRIMAYGDDRPIITAVGFTTPDDAPLRFQNQSNNELWHRFYIRDVMSADGQSGIMSAGQNIILSDMWVSHTSNNGIYTTQGNSNNIVQDCAVWHLGDGSSAHTNTGDCFTATAWTVGVFADTKFIRCFGANGPDDVYDLWGGVDNEIIDCVAYGGGYYWNGNPGSTSGGDGGGYKLGGSGGGGGKRNTIIGSLSVHNRTQGIQYNHSESPAEHTILNNTAYGNGGEGVGYGTASTTRNNISYQNGSSHGGSGGTVTNNSWQLGIGNPMFGDASGHDYSLLPGSPAIGVGYQGSNLGASEEALRIAKLWINRDLTGYAQPSWNIEETPTQTITYTADTTTDFQNPERGWYVEDGGGLGVNRQNANPVRSHVQYPTLQMRFVRLDDYVNIDTIPTWFITNLQNEMESWRSTGKKAILRFGYSRTPGASVTDAPIARMLGHVDQFAPLLHEYKDVIAVFQAGFVGRWAEMHDSTNNITSGNANGRAFVNKIMEVTPSDMIVEFRTPYWMTTTLPNTNHLAYEDRFTETKHARIGHFNDCIAAGYQWVTWWGDTPGLSWEQERDYAFNQGRLTSAGGETCSAGGGLGPSNDAPLVISQFQQMGIDYLNSEYWTEMYSKWNNSGHLAEISRRLGYRHSLVESTLPTTALPGQQIDVSFVINNQGFGKVFKPRPINLVLTQGGTHTRIQLTGDARRDLPLGGETKTLSYTATIPMGLSGTYSLSLELPDKSTHLNGDHRYSIRLANIGIWNNGLNSLNANITIG